ncbi:MAG: MFS transporter [Bacteroidia bacterium]|nr:MFS transporter [Bacteroidia bacterium]
MQNKKAISRLLLANIISGFAQGISMLSIPWYFTNIKKDEQLFSFAYVIVTIISIGWSLYAGTLIDRFSRKKVFVWLNICGAIILLSTAALGFITGDTPAFFVLLVFCCTMLIYSLHYPCLYAFGQEITERGNYGKLNSLIEVQGQSTTMIAGVAGALLLNGSTDGTLELLGLKIQLPFTIKAWSMKEIFLMDGITYLFAIVLIGSIKYIPVAKEKTDAGSVFERIKVGWNYLKQNKKVFLFGNASYSIFVVLLVEVHILLAWYVNNHLHRGGDVYASAEVYYALGALFAGLAIRKIFAGTNSVKAVMILMFITVAGLFWVSFSQQAWIFYVFSLVIGVTNAGARVLRTTWLFQHVPNNVMGRVGSVFNVLNIVQRLGLSLLFSLAFFSKASNVTWAYFIGAIFILLNLVPLFLRYNDLKK